LSAEGLPPSEERAGIAYAAGAYLLWGVLPLFWWLLRDVSPAQMTAHRILWCAVLLGAATAVRGRAGEIAAIIRTPRTLWTLALTAALITANWGVYLYALVSGQLVESALGYYMTPLVSFLLGVVLFGERPSKVRIFCILLAGGGVLVQLAAAGRLPWIALALAATFGLYGYFRKRAPVAALDGLLVETALFAPLAAGLIGWGMVSGTGGFLAGNPARDALLVMGGVLTIPPLALFAAGVRRVRMTTIAFLQYLAPTLSLFLAVLGFGEPFDQADLASFAFIWAAIAIAAVEGLRNPKGPGTPDAA
jgi:chloramphenicol-sensitive protein RarD